MSTNTTESHLYAVPVTTGSDPEADGRDSAIGATVAGLRRQRGMTQAEVATAMRGAGWPLAQPAIAKIELGKRPLRLAEAVDLAKALRVRVDDLVASPMRSAHMQFRQELQAQDRELDQISLRRSVAARRLGRLQDLAQLHRGMPTFWDEPVGTLRDTLGDLHDAQVDGILAELGVSTGEISAINEAPDRWERMWDVLTAHYPHLRDASDLGELGGSDQD